MDSTNVRYSDWEEIPIQRIKNMNFPTFYRTVTNSNTQEVETETILNVNQIVSEYFVNLEKIGTVPSHKKVRFEKSEK
jgi:hypothetical protein